MIRNIKRDIFKPGNIVAFNNKELPNHSCVGLKLEVIGFHSRTGFRGKVVKMPDEGQFSIGYEGTSWTKRYYILDKQDDSPN